MAKRTVVELVDDLDGAPISDGEGDTVVFSLERKAYEIDLSKDNIEKLREALAPFIEAARPASNGFSRAASASRARGTAGGRDLGAVRAWARENGHAVSERGRIPAAVLEAYDAAH